MKLLSWLKLSLVHASTNPHINTFVKHANLNSFLLSESYLSRCSLGNMTKTLLIAFGTLDPESAEIPYAVFIMLYNTLAELSKPMLGLNNVINPIHTALYMSVLIHCK